MKQEKDLMNGVWVTPPEFFDPLNSEFNLQIDSAASADNAMLPIFWDKEADAFKQDWTGKRIWCNPPYGKAHVTPPGIYKWVERCATGGASIVVALLPARTDTAWFHKFIYQKPNVEIRFVARRIKFSGCKGTGKFPSMVVIFKPAT